MSINIRKTAFMFPGQGSQNLGIMRELAAHFPEIQIVFKKASELMGYDLWHLAQEGPLARINQTVYTQPLLLTAEVALWELWRSQGGDMPHFFVGHSLGEYAAHVCANNLAFKDALRLVSMRGRMMQKAVNHIESAMCVVVGLSYEDLVAICQQAQQQEVVSVSSYNTREQVVLAGHLSAVNRAMILARQAGARLVKRLAISVPAHCQLMEPAAQALKPILDKTSFQVHNIPVLSNAYHRALKTTEEIKNSLLVQMYKPVFWVTHIEDLNKVNVGRFIECGPGRVLTHLTRTLVSNKASVMPIGNYPDFKKALEFEKSFKV